MTVVEQRVLPPLGDRQWSLDDKIVMGPGLPYGVTTFDFGPPDVRNQDSPIDGEDGDRFGVDTLSGRLISISAFVDLYDENDALNAAEVFEAEWTADDVRMDPGELSILRWRRGPRVRRAYGRSRPALTDHTRDWTGCIPITATFRTAEPVFYDDVEQSESVGMVPETVGGLMGDLIGDIISSGQGVGERGFEIGGTKPTWIPVVVRGPIMNPTVTIVDQWSVTLQVSLGAADFVLIDPRPWVRDVRRSDGANAAGLLTADSQVMSGMRLRPGRHRLVLTGADPTGTASADVYWRNCHAGH